MVLDLYKEWRRLFSVESQPDGFTSSKLSVYCRWLHFFACPWSLINETQVQQTSSIQAYTPHTQNKLSCHSSSILPLTHRRIYKHYRKYYRELYLSLFISAEYYLHHMDRLHRTYRNKHNFTSSVCNVVTHYSFQMESWRKGSKGSSHAALNQQRFGEHLFLALGPLHATSHAWLHSEESVGEKHSDLLAQTSSSSQNHQICLNCTRFTNALKTGRLFCKWLMTLAEYCYSCSAHMHVYS